MSTLILIFSFSRLWLPHGDLHLRIEDLTQHIRSHPDSLELYVKRGELYIQHEEYQLAEHDFQFCIHNGLTSSPALEGLSKSLGYQNKLDTALQLIQLVVEKDTASFSALEWKARITYLLKQYCDA